MISLDLDFGVDLNTCKTHVPGKNEREKVPKDGGSGAQVLLEMVYFCKKLNVKSMKCIFLGYVPVVKHANYMIP